MTLMDSLLRVDQSVDGSRGLQLWRNQNGLKVQVKNRLLEPRVSNISIKSRIVFLGFRFLLDRIAVNLFR